MIFKKPKGNQNKMKPRGRKRKLFASAMLILRLLFGGLQSASASSNSKNIQDGVDSKAVISRPLSRESSMIANLNQEGSTRSELVPEGGQLTLDTPSGQITLGLPRGGELGVNGSQNLDRDREQRLTLEQMLVFEKRVKLLQVVVVSLLKAISLIISIVIIIIRMVMCLLVVKLIRIFVHQMIKENILNWTKTVIVLTNGVKNLFE